MKKFNAEKELRKLKFRRNKEKYLKLGLVGLIVILAFVGGFYFSQSKYEESSSLEIINSKVNSFTYKDYIIASYIDGEESLSMPDKYDGYNFDHITCEDSSVNASWNSNTWTITIGEMSKRTRCSVYFVSKGYQSLSDIIINKVGGAKAIEAKGTPDFSTISTTNEGMYMAEDDYGKSYYYRGAVTDNNVIFGGFCWKIIRVNGDGSVRMIYNGTPTNNQCTTQTGEGTQIGTSAFNINHNDNAYVGYMYGNIGSSTYAATHANASSSTIKKYIDNWYKNNLISYSDKINDAIFCNDRSVALSAGTWYSSDTALGYGTNATYYGYFSRESSSYNIASTKNQVTLKCTNKNDRFTVSDTAIGNGVLTYPIALITADEINAAGGGVYANNSLYYLYTNQNYWSLSPSYFVNNIYGAVVYYVGSIGIGQENVDSTFGVRPTINLKETVEISGGDGSIDQPYIVK